MAVDRNFQSVEESIKSITGVEILEGRAVSVGLVSGSQNIAHQLGRSFRGWWLLDADDYTTVKRSTVQVDRTKFLTVESLSALSASFWVF